MRKFHQEIDDLRKSGSFKEALDLARYAYSKLPEHKLLKRSYSWAVYNYLKYKCTVLKEALSSGELKPSQLLNATDRRVIELNQLCREYRIHKLIVKDLCFSLILKQLCKFDPPPLGLYGLLKWSKSTSLREEDYETEIFDYKDKRIVQPPLVYRLARGLANLTLMIDQEPLSNPLLQSVNIVELAVFTSKVCVHAYQRCEPKRHEMLWEGCRLSRRGAEFETGIEWGVILLRQKEYPPEVWWEVAQCLAEESHWESLTKSMTIQSQNDQLSHAVSCALAGAHQARNQGLDEQNLVHVYARTAVWFSRIGDLITARALLTWAIKVLKDSPQKIPYDWVMTLDQMGGELHDYWPHLMTVDQQSYRQANDWLKGQKNIEEIS